MLFYDRNAHPNAYTVSFNDEMYSDTHLPYATLVAEWRALSVAQGFTLQEFVVGKPARRMLCARIGANRTQQILISAGVHGDEPVTPWALLDMVRRGLLNSRFGYMLWCCVNPTGYEDGMRENIDRVDINRTFVASRAASVEAKLIASVCSQMRFTLVLDLHEDSEADGFYCYEATRDAGMPRIGSSILARIRNAGFQLQQFSPNFDLGYSPNYLRTACRLDSGLVSMHHAAAHDDGAGAAMLTTYFMRRTHTERAVTIETPRRLAWNDRMAMQTIAVLGAID